MSSTPSILYPAHDIAQRVKALAQTLAMLPQTPQVAAPVLVSAFVFAADLMRALAAEGVHLQTEMLWLRSYGAGRAGGPVSVLVGPGPAVKERHVLLIDGVLDTGETLARATDLLMAAGAATVRTAVVVDKLRADAALKADHALFAGPHGFVAGYGMDDAGACRGLAYIGVMDG